MDSGALLRPVGPRPPRVYWARRLGLLAIAIVVVVLLAHACSGSGSSPTPAARPLPTATATPTATARAGPPAACRHKDLTVTAATDAPTYAAGVLPRLSAVVRNVSAQPCRFVTTPAARSWTIHSGADQVWASADCTISGIKGRTRLGPDKTIAYALVWNRHRSAKGCPTGTPAAAPGTYRLNVSVNGVQADTVVFHLTG